MYDFLPSTYMVHGSHPNITDKPRRAYINGFVRRTSKRSLVAIAGIVVVGMCGTWLPNITEVASGMMFVQLRASASRTPDCEWTFKQGLAVPLPSRYDYHNLWPQGTKAWVSRSNNARI